VQQTETPSPDYWHRFHSESVDSLVQQFMSLSERPTGIFVADDMQIALIQPALQSRGLEIGPGKTELISCNNEKPYLVGLSPKPAVIDIRVESIGRRGVEQLLWRLQHLEVPERVIATIEPFIVSSETPALASATA
jgi:LacI family transcriptional regulator, galactose operon repressor